MQRLSHIFHTTPDICQYLEIELGVQLSKTHFVQMRINIYAYVINI